MQRFLMTPYSSNVNLKKQFNHRKYDEGSLQYGFIVKHRKFICVNVRLFNNILKEETWSDVFYNNVETKYDICFPVLKSRIDCRKNKWITLDQEKCKH